MDNRVYWIWLQRAFGVGSEKPYSIYKRFKGGVKEFYEGGAPLWNSLTYISDKEASSLYNSTLSNAEAILDFCQKMKFGVITPECEKYPEGLRNIFDPPAVLYHKGKMPNFDTAPTITIVGARKATQESCEIATTIAYQLVTNNALIVSGGAVGIDAAAHRGAISGMGKSICILPVSIMSGYEYRNAGLRNRIVENGGVLLSEYATEENVSRGTFDIRNRLMTGISNGTVIIQAELKSGTMKSARFAKEQDRDLFVVPGRAEDPQYAGSAALIEDGAKAVTQGDDILCEYIHKFAVYGNNAVKRNVVPIKVTAEEPEMLMMADSKTEEPDTAGLSKDTKMLFLAMTKEPQHISVLEEKTGFTSAKILGLITELELLDKVKSYSGRRYSL